MNLELQGYFRAMIRSVIAVVLMCCGFTVNAQIDRKTLPATRTENPPEIDGILSDEAWTKAPVADDFVQFEPENGPAIEERFRTQVKVLYDDEAIYIGAMLYDNAPDSILTQLTQRDVYNENTDWFGFFINPYNDGLSDFNFWVTAAGVQADARTTLAGDDFSLNSIWSSKVSITDSGWVMEARIPYIALRFPKTPVTDWGLNFMRNVRRTRNTYTWNFLDKSLGYRLEYQCGLLTDMANIEPPVRLSAMPYASAYLDDIDGVTTYDFNAGLDLKYGINESFTLDMTVIPDFGQVAFDQQFLNLTPFENRFDENRQFFTEGTELFTIGDLFYSRRIGGQPKNITGVDLNSSDSVEIRQEFTRMLNATKVSGRTKGNLGIGILNAVTDDNFSTRIEDGVETEVLTEPLTNYNVLVLDQRFNRNSSVSLINTNVMRKGSAKDANVLGLLGSFTNKSGSHTLDVSAKQSALFQNDQITDGYEGALRLADVEGNWRWAINETLITDEYDINDLGFQQRNNQVRHYGEVEYITIQPVGRFNRINHTLFAVYESLYEPFRYEEFYLGYNAFQLMRSFFAFGVDFTTRPVESYDYFEPRTFGRWFKKPEQYNLSAFISSDYRKTIAIDSRITLDAWGDLGRQSLFYRLAPRLRFGDHFFAVVSSEYTRTLNDYGFVPDTIPSEIFFGRRNNTSVVNTIDARYVFNPVTSLSLVLRHSYTDVNYLDFFLLEESGELTSAPLSNVNDLNFNTFNVDLRFSWWFAPASEMVILYRNVIASIDNTVGESYIENVDGVLQAPMQNNISIRLTYFLDYYTMKNKIKNRNGRG